MIGHVSLEVRRVDGDACVAFWRRLGFVEVEPPEGLRGRTRWVQRDGGQVHLLWREDPVVPPAGHTAVTVGNYDATVAGLRAAGFEVDPRAEHWGAPRCFVREPAGHRVELMSAPPPGAG